MAKVIIENTPDSQLVWRSWAQVIGIGAAVGIIYWLVALLIGRFIIEPLTCRDVVEAAACTEASVLAGKISTVLIAIVAIFGMVRVGVARPLIIAVAAAILLWELSASTLGMFWLESLGWSVLLYALAYALFGWIARASSVVVAIVVTLVVVVGLRILLAL